MTNDFTISENIFKAASSNYIGSMKQYFADGYNIHDNDYYALQLAAKNGHLEMVQLLISYGANINTNNNSVFYYVVKEGHMDILQYALPLNKDKDLPDALLGLSASIGRLDFVQFMLEQNADLSYGHYIPLRQAYKNGYLEIVKYFINECHLDISLIENRTTESDEVAAWVKEKSMEKLSNKLYVDLPINYNKIDHKLKI